MFVGSVFELLLTRQNEHVEHVLQAMWVTKAHRIGL